MVYKFVTLIKTWVLDLIEYGYSKSVFRIVITIQVFVKYSLLPSVKLVKMSLSIKSDLGISQK